MFIHYYLQSEFFTFEKVTSDSGLTRYRVTDFILPFSSPLPPPPPESLFYQGDDEPDLSAFGRVVNNEATVATSNISQSSDSMETYPPAFSPYSSHPPSHTPFVSHSPTDSSAIAPHKDEGSGERKNVQENEGKQEEKEQEKGKEEKEDIAEDKEKEKEKGKGKGKEQDGDSISSLPQLVLPPATHIPTNDYADTHIVITSDDMINPNMHSYVDLTAPEPYPCDDTVPDDLIAHPRLTCSRAFLQIEEVNRNVNWLPM